MDKLTTWAEFIKRVDPKGEKMTQEKFAKMVMQFMVLYYKQKKPPKHN